MELSVKPCQDWGGLSALNLSLKHLGSFSSEDWSADQETWIMQASASSWGCFGTRSFKMKTSPYWLVCSPYRFSLRHSRWSSTCSKSLCVFIKQNPSTEQLQRCIRTTISRQQLCCAGHEAVSWELVWPITPQRTVIKRATEEVQRLAEGVLRKRVIRPGEHCCWWKQKSSQSVEEIGLSFKKVVQNCHQLSQIHFTEIHRNIM